MATEEEIQEQFRLQKYREMGLYNKLHGIVIQKLPAVRRIWTNDLFLVSKPRTNEELSSDKNILNDYFDGRFIIDESQSHAHIVDENPGMYFSASRDSYAIRYADLCACILTDTYSSIKLGSMAYEQSVDYAPNHHDHDDVYSYLSAKSYYPVKDYNKYWHLGTLTISSYSDNGQLSVKSIQFNCPIPEMPTFKDPDVGTLRFIVQDQLTAYQMRQYGDGYNIDIYSNSFDGWVYPNGTTFITEVSSDFEIAKNIYGIDKNSFRVPDLRHFIKLNPGINRNNAMQQTKYQNAMLAHTHNIKNLKCSGDLSFSDVTMYAGDRGLYSGTSTICGWGLGNSYIGEIQTHASGTLTNAKFIGTNTQDTDESLDTESKPVHNIMPVMVFIGRRTI